MVNNMGLSNYCEFGLSIKQFLFVQGKSIFAQRMFDTLLSRPFIILLVKQIGLIF